jgi:hypothetical protein
MFMPRPVLAPSFPFRRLVVSLIAAFDFSSIRWHLSVCCDGSITVSEPDHS